MSEAGLTDFINIYITPVCWILICLYPEKCILGCATEFVLLVTRKLHGQDIQHAMAPRTFVHNNSNIVLAIIFLLRSAGIP